MKEDKGELRTFVEAELALARLHREEYQYLSMLKQGQRPEKSIPRVDALLNETRLKLRGPK